MDFNRWNPFWTACFGVLAFVIIIGNSFSISILLNRRLRKRPHYLLIRLAFADLMVGLFAIPIYMTAVISGQKPVDIIYVYWIFLDIHLRCHFSRETPRCCSPTSSSAANIA